VNVRVRKRILAVALTGGIATGKSAVTQRFANLGVPIFDADVIAREVVAAGQPVLGEIAASFGAQVIRPDGELDRARTREIVFADTNARQRLEAIIHPRVRASLLDQVSRCAAAYCVLAIPLLVECYRDYTWVDRVVTTDAPREVQLRRLIQRPGIDANLARRMLDAQATRQQRLALAHDIIDNTSPIAVLDAAVQRLHRLYLELAAARPES